MAKAACFSPYHFHRIFRALVGETVHSFVKRVRLERAVVLLSHRDRPSMTEVALACGFYSSSTFSRGFREQYGVAPRAFDVEEFRRSRRQQLVGADGLAHLPAGSNPDGFTARVRPLPARRVAYLRVLRPYESGRVTRGRGTPTALGRRARSGRRSVAGVSVG